MLDCEANRPGDMAGYIARRTIAKMFEQEKNPNPVDQGRGTAQSARICHG
jgi:hypothetical protein